MLNKYWRLIGMLSLFGVGMTSEATGAAQKNEPTSTTTVRMPKFAYVGCFTTADRDGRGTGIEVFSIDAKSGAWTKIQSVPSVNPGFLAMDSRQKSLYVSHGGGTVVTAYAINQENGQLTFLNEQPTGGKNGAHLTVDPSDKYVLVANNSSGDVAVVPINEDGSLGGVSDVVTLTGKSGPHRIDQGSSHPHQVSFDPSGKFVIVADVGLDRVFIYQLDLATGKLIANEPPSVATRAGAGPRHFAFHPDKPYTYVINGLDSTITTYQLDSVSGALNPLQVMPALPASFVNDSNASEVMVLPSGKFAYGATRCSDMIGVFAIEQQAGVLTPVEWVSTQGKGPRFFALDPAGTQLYACNLSTDTIVIFRINQRTGKLTPTGQVVPTGSPSCIVFR